MNKGIIASIFDLSFDTFIVPRMLKIFYVVALAAAGFFTLALVFTMFSAHIAAGVFGLVFAPVIFCIYALLARMQIELIMVQFAINRNVAALTQHVTGSLPPNDFGVNPEFDAMLSKAGSHLQQAKEQLGGGRPGGSSGPRWDDNAQSGAPQGPSAPQGPQPSGGGWSEPSAPQSPQSPPWGGPGGSGGSGGTGGGSGGGWS